MTSMTIYDLRFTIYKMRIALSACYFLPLERSHAHAFEEIALE
jgi:hypothetical protein